MTADTSAIPQVLRDYIHEYGRGDTFRLKTRQETAGRTIAALVIPNSEKGEKFRARCPPKLLEGFASTSGPATRYIFEVTGDIPEGTTRFIDDATETAVYMSGHPITFALGTWDPDQPAEMPTVKCGEIAALFGEEQGQRAERRVCSMPACEPEYSMSACSTSAAVSITPATAPTEPPVNIAAPQPDGLADNQGLIDGWGAQADAEPDKLTSVKAKELANDPNKLKELLDIFEKRHIGDRDQAHLCLLCALLIRVVNASEGTDVVISGERAAGKTNFADTIAKLIPQTLGKKTALIQGEQSDKWITRALEAGVIGNQCVMFFDDTFKSEASTLWQKQLTTWDTPHSYQVLESDGKGFVPKSFPLPRKTVRIRVSVDEIRDEQESSRVLNLHLQNSPERDYAIREHVRKMWSGKDTEEIENEFFVVQRMWEMLPAEVKVTFPESIRITGGEGDNRLYQRVMSLIASQAVFRAGIKQTEITVTREDAEPVVRLMNEYLAGKTGGGAEGMDAAPRKLLNTMIDLGLGRETGIWEGTQAELERKTGICHAQVSRGLYGRKRSDGKYSEGLTQLGYVESEELTKTEIIDYTGTGNTRKTKKERNLRFDYKAACEKTEGIRFEVHEVKTEKQDE